MALGLVGAIYGIATILGPSVGSLILDLFGTEKDYGNGMDKKTQENLFKRFFKGYEGDTGLGLPISKAIIEKLGGSIDVISNNSGTCVTIYLRISN